MFLSKGRSFVMARKIYVAISKDTGAVMTGAKGQHAFSHAGSLNSSMSQQFWNKQEAKNKGVKVRDLYDVFVLTNEQIEYYGRKI
jgi:hypothetical protein